MAGYALTIDSLSTDNQPEIEHRASVASNHRPAETPSHDRCAHSSGINVTSSSKSTPGTAIALDATEASTLMSIMRDCGI